MKIMMRDTENLSKSCRWCNRQEGKREDESNVMISLYIVLICLVYKYISAYSPLCSLGVGVGGFLSTCFVFLRKGLAGM